MVHYHYRSQIKLISSCLSLKISNSNIFTRCKQKPPELVEVEGFQSEKIVSLKNKRKSYIGKITKTINRITNLIDKQVDFPRIIVAISLWRIILKV